MRWLEWLPERVRELFRHGIEAICAGIIFKVCITAFEWLFTQEPYHSYLLQIEMYTLLGVILLFSADLLLTIYESIRDGHKVLILVS